MTKTVGRKTMTGQQGDEAAGKGNKPATTSDHQHPNDEDNNNGEGPNNVHVIWALGYFFFHISLCFFLLTKSILSILGTETDPIPPLQASAHRVDCGL